MRNLLRRHVLFDYFVAPVRLSRYRRRRRRYRRPLLYFVQDSFFNFISLPSFSFVDILFLGQATPGRHRPDTPLLDAEDALVVDAILESDERVTGHVADRTTDSLGNTQSSLITTQRQHLAKSGTPTRPRKSEQALPPVDTPQPPLDEVVPNRTPRGGLVRDSRTFVEEGLYSLFQATEAERATLKWFLESTGVNEHDDFNYLPEGNPDTILHDQDGRYHGEFKKLVFRMKFFQVVEYIKGGGSIHGKTLQDIRRALLAPSRHGTALATTPKPAQVTRVATTSKPAPLAPSSQQTVKPDQAFLCASSVTPRVTSGTPRGNTPHVGKTVETLVELALSQEKSEKPAATVGGSEPAPMKEGSEASLSWFASIASSMAWSPAKSAAEDDSESRPTLSSMEQHLAGVLKHADNTTVDDMDPKTFEGL